MNKPTGILQEFVIHTYLWVLPNFCLGLVFFMQRGARGTWIEISHLQQYTETQLVHYILVLSQHLARKFHLRAPHLAWVSPYLPHSRFSTVTIFALGCVCGSATTLCAIIYILFG